MDHKKHQQLTMRFPPEVGPRAHALFDYPLLDTLIGNLMPSLKEERFENGKLLNSIQYFLFSSNSEGCQELERQLNEELYACLYGLKAILLSFNNNWKHAMYCLNEHRKLSPNNNSPFLVGTI